MQVILFLMLFKMCKCDWVSEWLAPVQYEYKGVIKPNNTIYQERKHVNIYVPQYLIKDKYNAIEPVTFKPNEENTPIDLKIQIEEILGNAAILMADLQKEISSVEERERLLKEAIANGRSGVTTAIISTLGRPPRTYIIRDGTWTLCNGLIQHPLPTKSYNLFSSPRCIGQEVTSSRDPCVFNSIIKYETIPASRRSFYTEDDYFCLKPTFNNTLETYRTVPKRIVDETCKDGVVRTLDNNIFHCGIRVLSEYSYYPYRSESVSYLPLEYCSEQDGSCKLMLGWHITNKSIENFEFLNNDKNFKKFFVEVEDESETFI